MKIYISPFFRGEDKGDGGIRRVVEAQNRYMPQFGVELVDTEDKADVVIIHAGADVNTLKPTVAICHGLYWNQYTWDRWCHKLNQDVIKVMNKATVVSAVSEWVANAIRRGMMIPCEVVYHGINTEEWQPGNNENYVLWNKTRIDPICDPSPVNDLAKYLKTVQFVTTYGTVAPNVKVTGKLSFDAAKTYIQNAGVYLCTTRETFGIGTLEAISCGVPILGWAWGGQSEFIESGVHGWLCTPGDIQGLIEGYEYIQAHREEISANCRELAKIYTWEKAAQKYVDLCQRAFTEENTAVKVSIVIPCYNLGDLARDAVRSVESQRFQDYEIVLVNDASTDDSREKLEALCNANPKIRLINNETNQYLAGALNTGIEAARGKYIIPLDADNMLGEHTLEVLSNALDKDPAIGVAYGSMEVIEPNGKRFISGWPSGFNFIQQLSHHNQCPSTSMYRKRIWKRVGGYRVRCRTAEDADFWCRVSSFGGNPRKVTDAVTLIYRNRHESMSHTEADWPWNEWYGWNNDRNLIPYSASVLYGYYSGIDSFDPPKISIIIPCGPGHSKYIPDAIDSLVSQAFTKWEAIVVNDSGEKLTLPPFVRIFNTDKPGSGPAVARNIGIKNSRGSLFLLLDADDYLQLSALQTMYGEFLNSRQYVYSDWIVQETKELKVSPEYSCDEVLKGLKHTVTALYPKQGWIDVGGFDESFKFWEDWDFIIALNAKGYCGHRISKPLFQYRMNSGTLRETSYANKEDAKKQIYSKWSEYFDGGKKLMACGGCSKKRNSTPPTQASVQAPVQSATQSLGTQTVILLEFIKPGAGATTFRGASGTLYRFGSDPAHRVKYVYKQDVDGLLALRQFRVVNTEVDNVLEAKGPPNR